MSEFTKGKWEYWKDANYPYWYVGKKGSGRYLATVDKEANARLIAAASEMYQAITECADTLEAIKNSDECKETADLYQLEELIHALWELLARIDGKEEQA